MERGKKATCDEGDVRCCANLDCDVTGRDRVDKKCARCLAVCHCSTECQRQHWRRAAATTGPTAHRRRSPARPQHPGRRRHRHGAHDRQPRPVRTTMPMTRSTRARSAWSAKTTTASAACASSAASCTAASATWQRRWAGSLTARPVALLCEARPRSRSRGSCGWSGDRPAGTRRWRSLV